MTFVTVTFWHHFVAYHSRQFVTKFKFSFKLILAKFNAKAGAVRTVSQ